MLYIMLESLALLLLVPVVRIPLCAIIEKVHLATDWKLSNMLLLLYMESVLFSVSTLIP
jgi:hypothetical protein